MKTKLLTLLTLLVCVCSGAWADPTPGDANSTYLDISRYSTIETAGGYSGVTNLTHFYDYDSSKGILRVTAYGSVSARSKQTWVTISANGIGQNKEDWSAQGDFAGRSAFYSSTDNNCLTRFGTGGAITYIVTNCTKVSALFNTRSASNEIGLEVYEQNSDGTDPETPVCVADLSYKGTNEVYTLSKDGLDKTKVYKCVVQGLSGNTNFYEIAFTSGAGGSGKTALTGAWSPTSVSVAVGDDTPSNPQFALSAGTLNTDYTVTYSEVEDENNIVTTDATTGITAISTATAGTATIRATAALTTTGEESYTLATTTYDIVISVTQGACEVPTYTVGEYDYDKGGYKVTFACDTEGATLKYVLTGDNPNDGSQSTYFDGSEQTYTEPIYVKGYRMIIQASKDNYTNSYSTKGSRYQTSSAPTGTSPEVIGWNVRGNSNGEANQDHGNRAVTLAGGHFAGNNNIFSSTNGEFKMRLAPNGLSSGIDGVNLFMKMDVKSGYKVTQVTFDKIRENTDNGGLTINNVYVDGTALASFEAISIPKSSESILENTEIDLSGATNGGATSNVVISFARTSDNTIQYNAITTVTYAAATTTVTTNAGKWASFTPSWNATLSDGATAYIITDVTGDNITASPVSVLKAGEGYFVKGAAVSTAYTATATADAASATTDNMIEGCTENTTINGSTPDSKAKYVLGTVGTQSGLFLVNSDVTVTAGKAYLQTDIESNAARQLSLDFDSETTGIETMKAQKNLFNGDFFDLQGRKVAQPTKGLYIMNGKKVIIK